MDNIIIDGLKLMITGMGMVFVFLSIMVLLISILAKVLKPFAHLLEEATEGVPSGASAEEEKDVVAAIVAAVHKYRNKS